MVIRFKNVFVSFGVMTRLLFCAFVPLCLCVPLNCLALAEDAIKCPYPHMASFAFTCMCNCLYM